MIKKMQKLPFCLLWFSLFFTGCIHNNCKESDYTINLSEHIKSPDVCWTYYEDSPILFSTDIKSDNIEWFSNKEGFLGKGNGLLCYLNKGIHKITCQLDIVQYSFNISVFQKNDMSYKSFILNKTDNKIFLEQGNYFAGLYNSSLNDDKIKFNGMNPSSQKRFEKDYLSYIEKKCFHINNLQDFSLTMKLYDYQSDRSITDQIDHEEILYKTKNFYVCNTNEQNRKPHEIQMICAYSSEHTTVWIEQELFLSSYDLSNIIYCVEQFEDNILPRLTVIWGKWSDVDKDEKIAFVFSRTINYEQKAIGFFNPSDYFFKDINNPYSNQSDIIYLGLPDETSESYSLPSITATIAHEMTHAITFSLKTNEELFLNEGLSHLSENLCGYGVSGGNIKFLETFFKASENYSFNGKNSLGKTDTIGNRGATMLFLSWCFTKCGGMNCCVKTSDAKENVAVEDSGGIEFLRRIETSEKTGIDCIVDAYNYVNQTNHSIQTIFHFFILDLLMHELSEYIWKKDVITGEPIDFFCNMTGFPYTFPVQSQVNDSCVLLPLSVVFMDVQAYSENRLYNVLLNKINPDVIMTFVKK